MNDSANLTQMDGASLQREFATRVCKPDAAALHTASGNFSAAEQRAAVAGALVWSAFMAPAASTSVFDIVAAGVLSRPGELAVADVEEAALPDAFWDAFANVLAGPAGGYDAGSITAAVASLGASVGEDFAPLAEAAAASHPGADDPARKPMPALISLQTLSVCPPDSLARTLHRMLVDNGFDPEVLDRESLGLSDLTPALRYLNTRILQMHDVWHLVAGYETTALHEIAISSFQLAQFGHNYSGMFLAFIVLRSHLGGGLGYELLMRTIAEAWHHGRENPPFMAVEFEEEWQDSIDTIRTRHGIQPFQGSFPADLFERLAAQPAAASSGA
ncbi:MAG: Coq4 family protein [Pseudomonadota bacterium]